MRGCYPPKAWLHFLFVVAVAALCWLGFAAAQEGPIGTKAYPCLTAEAKGELDQLDREISNIESNLLRYGDDEETVRDAIKSGQTDSIDQFTYMRHFGHDLPDQLGEDHSPQELLEQIVRKIQYYKDRLEQLKKRRGDLSGLPPCPPEPDKAAAPPPPVTPVTPPKITPVPVTPPVAETPKPAVKVCPKCRSIAGEIQVIDQEIARLERQDQSLNKYSDLKDPGIQRTLKEDASTIAGLKSKKAALETKMTECEKKCGPTTEEKKTEGKTEHGTSGKTNEHKATDKKKGRKKKDDTAHETGVGLPSGFSIGIGSGGGRREERGNDIIPRSDERGRQGGGGIGGGGGTAPGR